VYVFFFSKKKRRRRAPGEANLIRHVITVVSDYVEDKHVRRAAVACVKSMLTKYNVALLTRLDEEAG
jgi:hypothetical protein